MCVISHQPHNNRVHLINKNILSSMVYGIFVICYLFIYFCDGGGEMITIFTSHNTSLQKVTCFL